MFVSRWMDLYLGVGLITGGPLKWDFTVPCLSQETNFLYKFKVTVSAFMSIDSHAFYNRPFSTGRFVAPFQTM